MRAKRKAGVGVIITGDQALDAALKEFEPKVQKALTRKATRAGAKIVLAAAQVRVPILTASLEGSLKVRAMKRRKGSRRGKKFGHSVVAGEGFFMGDQFYGGFVEFGTGQRFHGSGKSVGEITPGDYDFLRPALYESKASVRAVFQRTMKTVISEARMKKTRAVA